MASPQVHHLFHAPIADHSFSTDKQTLAVARENNVELYQQSGNKFALSDELKGHEKTVTSVDIAPNSGRIVTCSQDRNAYVWEQTPSGWKPTLVLLRINRAATFVRWSPSEQKFAVGSGARVIAVCYFEEENDWWISKHLKKPIRSTITTLAWHPNSVLLAAGSTDSHARVFSSFIKGIDTRPEPSAWGERLPFNTICGEYLNDTAGWIQGVAFSPSGNALAFTGHDSSVTVVYPSAPEQPPRAMLNISTRLLPLNSLIWNGETEIIAAGHDCEPFRFQGDENGWQLAGSLEKKAGDAGGAREESALNMFRQMDLKGQASADTKLKSTHQNTVNTIRVHEGSNGAVSSFSRILLSDSCGYIALSHSSKRIILAFRGTYSITNTIIDLSAYPQAYIPYEGEPGAPGPKCANCTVHAGFMNSWLNTRETVLPHVAQALQRYPGYEVTLVGHSLGGAVAALAGLEMRIKGWDPLVTTFGEPMVGNEDFVRFFDDQFGFGDAVGIPPMKGRRLRRVTHIDDPVPLLPLQEWGYRAHAGEIFISRSELPPRMEDVHVCVGDYDPRCLSGSDGPAFNIFKDADPSTPRADCQRGEPVSGEGQIVIGKDGDQDHADCEVPGKDRLSSRRWGWSLIPARYRLWELFYAHRDYFWRIGLCVPGGDPTG
ncbi:Lipase class 3 [Penicillium brevicompactum]|uniref:Arp2/3 complex 41 kDa subunit n=1 Tax=Penicillium brevicompactum TaxID=5074 RepID=A0A9W9Q7N5_PENBR|nr:Lipase class 3 [Penicillium brevicompactum]